MAKNNLYTKSYLNKRLIESGFNTAPSIDRYPNDDIRQWTIIVDPGIKEGRANILLTCFKESPDNFWFVANTKRNLGLKISTLSANTLAEILHDLIEGPAEAMTIEDINIPKE